MAYNLIICITYFLEMLISYTFFSQISKKKLHIFRCFATGTLLFESIALINIMFSNVIWLNAICFALINVLFGSICFTLKTSKILFYSILLDIFVGVFEFVTIFLISLISKTDPYTYLENINFLIIDIAISKTLYFFTCLVLSRLEKEEKSNIKFPVGLYFYPLVVLCSLLVFWNICVKTNISNVLQILLCITGFSLFVSVIILFIIYQHHIEKENELFLLHNELDKIQTDKTYYDILEKQNQELMIYVHDAKKHLSAIKELNDNPIIDEYVRNMTDDLKAYSSSCHSGNHMLDVIINKYDTECKIKNIKFSYDVKLCNLNFVNNYDLVTILNNLLDNAIEAAKNSSNPFVSLSTEYTNTYAVITIANNIITSPIVINDKLITTKKNKKQHGIGIKSVKRALSKYDGDLEWEYDESNKIFTITVILLCP